MRIIMRFRLLLFRLFHGRLVRTDLGQRQFSGLFPIGFRPVRRRVLERHVAAAVIDASSAAQVTAVGLAGT